MIKFTPYGILTSGPTVRICTKTPNFEDTFYLLMCVRKQVNVIDKGEATRVNQPPLLLNHSGLP